MNFTQEQINAVVDWMNEWEQLKDTSIPIRFKQDFSSKMITAYIQGFTNEITLDWPIVESTFFHQICRILDVEGAPIKNTILFEYDHLLKVEEWLVITFPLSFNKDDQEFVFWLDGYELTIKKRQ